MDIRKIITIFLILGFSFLIYNYIQTSKFYINEVTLSSNKINKPIRITQISDFHSNGFIDLDELLKSITKFSPDIITITGDFIDSRTIDFSLVFQFISRLKEIPAKIYFVGGNHEFRNSLSEALYKEMKTNGIIILEDTSEKIIIKDNNILVYGSSFFAEDEDYERLYKNINVDNYNLLLTHSPYKAIRYASNNLDLILAGHTHGGQVRLPFIGSIVSPGGGFFPKYDKGIYKLEDTILYIDSGLGNSLLPVRLFNRVQITNIEID